VLLIACNSKKIKTNWKGIDLWRDFWLKFAYIEAAASFFKEC
jgi:hypothetical protein